MNFIKRVARCLFTWKMAGRLLFAVACLGTLAALLVVEENWRGKRDWQAFVRGHDAGGDLLDMTPLIPPQVPDEQNFAMTPLLKPLFANGSENYRSGLGKKLMIPVVEGKTLPSMGDHNKGRHIKLEEWQAYLGDDVLDWLQKVRPELDEISEAARRPYVRFPLAYEQGFAMSFPHIEVFMRLGKLYALRAEAELQAGKTDAALADAQTIFRLGESMKDDPVPISQLVWLNIWQNGLQVVWEGLEDRLWTDAQLQVLQDELARADFLKSLARALHGERAGMNDIVLATIEKPELLPGMMAEYKGADRLLRFVPSGLMYRNLLEVNRVYEKYVLPSVNPAARRVYPDLINAAQQAVSFHVYKVLEKLTMPSIYNIVSKVAFEQSSNDQAVVACALERYRLANGQFPDALAKLTPAYIGAIPPGVTNGEPPHYRLNGDGTFLLYSDGWDGNDNGGKLVLKSEKGGIDIMKSNWVWSVKPE